MTQIYALVCPLTKHARYIGKANNPVARRLGHIRESESGAAKHHKGHWIRKLLGQGMTPELRVLFDVPSDMRWQIAERFFIASARYFRFDLTNTTIGGEGIEVDDPEWIRKRAEARKRFYRENPDRYSELRVAIAASFNKPEVKAKKSSAMLAAWKDEVKGERLRAGGQSDQRKAKTAEAARKNWSDPNYVAKQSAAMAVVHATPEFKAKMSKVSIAAHADPEIAARRIASLRANGATPEFKAKMSEVSKEVHSRPEVKEALSASITKSWQDPAVRAKHAAGVEIAKPAMSEKASMRWRDPERRAKLQAAQRAGWADPEKKASALAYRQTPEYKAKQAAATAASWAKRKSSPQSGHRSP